MRIDTGADRRCAKCETREPRQNSFQSHPGIHYLAAPGAHLLRNKDWQRIHQVRSARLDLVSGLLRPGCDRLCEGCKPRQQHVAQLERGSNMDGGGDHVVAALAAVDVVVRVNRRAKALAGKSRNDFVDVHVRAGAGARLHDADRKLVCVTAAGDLERRRGDAGSERRRKFAEFAIGLGCGPLDEADCPDQRRRHALLTDADVVDRALRLGAPERRRCDRNVAEAVLFDAVLVAHG